MIISYLGLQYISKDQHLEKYYSAYNSKLPYLKEITMYDFEMGMKRFEQPGANILTTRFTVCIP